VRRLREAIELDCDARVLRRAPDARQYGALLLEVGRRRAAPVLGVALAEPVSLLERRIRQITARAKAVNVRRVASLGGLALLLAAIAVCTRDPMAPVSVLAGAAGPPMVATQSLGGPAFTPFTVAPRILNRAEFAAALQANYPPQLEAAIGGVVEMWFHIDETGVVQQARLGKRSSFAALDEAALLVARQIRFSPALNDDRPVSVWVVLPLRFSAGDETVDESARVGGSAERETEAAVPTERPVGAASLDGKGRTAMNAGRPEPELDLRVPVPALASDNFVSLPPPAPAAERGPVFTPFTEPPRLVNADDAGRAMEREYPVLLRTSGVGGTVKVWFHIDAQGRVQATVVGETSGFAGLDEAALRVARDMVFEPARNGSEPVATWVSLPIKFSTR
jgi:TonB family protein